MENKNVLLRKKNHIYLVITSEDKYEQKKSSRDFLYLFYNFLATTFILNMVLDRNYLTFNDSI